MKAWEYVGVLDHRIFVVEMQSDCERDGAASPHIPALGPRRVPHRQFENHLRASASAARTVLAPGYTAMINFLGKILPQMARRLGHRRNGFHDYGKEPRWAQTRALLDNRAHARDRNQSGSRMPAIGAMRLEDMVELTRRQTP